MANSSEREKILITGGTGFIGSHLARQLTQLGHQIVLFDIQPNHHRIDDFKDKVEVVKGDVAKRRDLEETIRTHKIKHIFHTAASLSVNAERDISSAYSGNIDGTYNILEACHTMQIQKVVFLSSLAVFGANTPFPFHEKSYRDPGSFYGVSKAFGEMLGQYYHLRHNLDFRCVRFAVIIGPGRRGAGATVTFSSLIEKIALGKPAVVDVPESTLLPITYVDDSVGFLIALWQADKFQRRPFIVGGVPATVTDLIAEMKKHMDKVDVRFEIDSEAERVATTWSFLTTLLIQQGQEELYRDIKEVGWKLKYNTTQDIVKRFVEDVQSHKEIYSAF
ncbi:MAG: NAD-dependent epimerase/dehydratase family protein [Promethearchaeota archaeon]